MAQFLETVNRWVWGAPALILILGVGLFFTIWLDFFQFRLLPKAFRHFWNRITCRNEEGTSSFRALCTALAATVGTGNLVGVAGAIALGGPGSIFWMWVCGLLGMGLKFAEATLAVHFRTSDEGNSVGGPMYMIQKGLPKKWRFLGPVYAFMGIFAAFGVGNATQINALITGVHEMTGILGFTVHEWSDLLIGVILAIVVGMMLLGGASLIGKTAQVLVPFASCAYLALCCFVLIRRVDAIPSAFTCIFRGAFSPRAVTGGAVASAFGVLRVGISRGVFTNEAGMGTASMAHASAQVSHPCDQGLMGIMEVFLDTILICTMTALVILCSGIAIPYGTDAGGELTLGAFRMVCGDWVSLFLTLALGCFGFATILGWGYYGAVCARFLLGPGSWKPFALMQSLVVILGAVLKTSTVWTLAEILNGLMAIPNLLALVFLRQQLRELTFTFFRKSGIRAGGGTYENFNQRKPLRTLSYAEIPPSGRGGQEGG